MREPLLRTPWLNVLIILLTMIASAVMVQMLWGLLSPLADIILLFVLAWLVAFALGPLIERLESKPLSSGVAMFAEQLFGRTFAHYLERFRFTRLAAVVVVYVALALVLSGVIAVLIPLIVDQLRLLTVEYPDFAKIFSDMTPTLLRVLAEIGLRSGDINSALSGALGSLQNLATLALQNAFAILGGIVTLMGNLLLVLLLSFFFALDGPQLFHKALDLVPEEYVDDVQRLAVTIGGFFGGYLRATLLQAFLMGVGTAMLLGLFGEPYLLVASLFAGFFMLIPFVGSALAFVPPIVATLSNDPAQAPLIFIILLVYQSLMLNVLMPKLLSEALGLHPLIIIFSLLIGVRIGGFWGAFFGVPVAGVILTVALFLYKRLVRSYIPADAERPAFRQSAPPSDVASL